MHTLVAASITLLLFAVTLPLVLLGQATPAPEFDVAAVLQLVTQMADALHRGETTLAVVFLSIGITQVVRHFGAKRFPIINTPKGGYVLALVTGLLTELSVSLGMGAPLTLMTVANALLGAFASIGVHQARKLKAQAEEAGAAAAAGITSPQAALDAMGTVDGNASLKGPGPHP